MPITGLRGEVLPWGAYLKVDPGSDLGLNRPRVSQTLGVDKIGWKIGLWTDKYRPKSRGRPSPRPICLTNWGVWRELCRCLSQVFNIFNRAISNKGQSFIIKASWHFWNQSKMCNFFLSWTFWRKDKCHPMFCHCLRITAKCSIQQLNSAKI